MLAKVVDSRNRTVTYMLHKRNGTVIYLLTASRGNVSFSTQLA